MPIMHDPNDDKTNSDSKDPSMADQGDEELNDDEFDVQDAEEVNEDEMMPEGDVAYDMDEMELEEGEAAETIPDDSKTTFTAHKGSVFCVNIDGQDNKWIVSGGEDDKAYVWDVENATVRFECAGHKDSVTCAAFSSDSRYLATADMSGVIQAWKTENGEKCWEFETGDVEWLEWHQSAPVLFVGTTDGEVWMWKIPSGDTKTFQSHGCQSNVGKVMPDGKRLCCGYEDGIVKFWDLKSASILHTVSGHLQHSGPITALDCHHDNNLVASGSTDTTAKLINSTNGKVVSTLNCSTTNEGVEDDGVEAVQFHNSEHYLATGTLTGKLMIWDVSTQKCRFTCSHQAGIVRLKWSHDQPLIYSGTLDGIVHLWDSRSGQEVKQWGGHTEEILDMALSRNSKYIVTASGDGTCKTFEVSPDNTT